MIESNKVTFLLIFILAACGPQPAPSASAAAAACGPGARLLQVAQGQMEPALQAGDIVEVVPFPISGPQRGDIVAINWRAWIGDLGPDAPYRVIGVAGDRVGLRDGRVVLNGSMLDEAYVDDGVTNPVPGQGSNWIVPDGSFFVLGDSRTSAADSRSAYGFVPNGALLGRVLNRCAPSATRSRHVTSQVTLRVAD